jgi:U2-associated protein SR140
MAWKFRQEFQSRLGLVFDHFSTIYHSFPGRITAETFKSQITTVLDIWEDWIVFPPEFTLHLRQRIEGQVQEEAPKVEETPVVVEEHTPAPVSRFKTSSFKPAEEPAEHSKAPASQDDGGEAPMDEESDIDGEPLGDVDGEPMDDVDGEPMDDIDGAPLDDDIDGAPLEDDIDGAPLDDDIDGAPMEDAGEEPMI